MTKEKIIIEDTALPPKESVIKAGWYKATYRNKEYDRIIYVKGSDTVVFCTNGGPVQFYNLESSKELYKKWTPITNIKLEVE